MFKKEPLSFEYTLVRSVRSRNIRVTVFREDGKVKVTAPFLAPDFLIEKFLRKKEKWIRDKSQKFLKNPPAPWNIKPSSGWRKDYLKRKKEALKLVKERLAHFKELYASRDWANFSWQKISIRNQKSRWGSCSTKGNLNFNYRIVLLPVELQDYLIVHELCHLIEFNHSRKFWELVGKGVSGYGELRGRLLEMRD